jgi:uroporphyrinogen decarboxylase
VPVRAITVINQKLTPTALTTTETTKATVYRQRVIDALEHRQTDLTPWNFELTREFAIKLKSRTGCEDESSFLKNHMMFGKFKRNRQLSVNTYEDMWGVHWESGGDGGDIGTVVNRLIGEDSVDAYRFPEVDVELVRAAAKEMESDRVRFRMFRLTYALFERAWSLMGMEELMACMLLDPTAVSGLLDRITEFQLQVLEAILPNDFEGVYFGDDWGTQRGLLMGPDLWRKFIKPRLARMFDLVKRSGKYVLLHSCGNIEDVLPDLVDIGLDVYNTVQPELYNLAGIKKEYGKHLAFWGAISTQGFLPFATPEQVRAKCAQAIGILGKGGGYILAATHAVTPDVPVENVLAMLECAQSIKWEVYP